MQLTFFQPHLNILGLQTKPLYALRDYLSVAVARKAVPTMWPNPVCLYSDRKA